jgi:predicted DNA binding CopG/RHH family protein
MIVSKKNNQCQTDLEQINEHLKFQKITTRFLNKYLSVNLFFNVNGS